MVPSSFWDPKMAVPMRMMVAPSSIATSKSPVIPMERCRTWRVPLPVVARSCRAASAASRNIGRDPSGSGRNGPMVISPATRRSRTRSDGQRTPGRAPADRARISILSPSCSPRRGPRTVRPTSPPAGRSPAPGKVDSTAWIRWTQGTMDLTLFVWRWPMKCQRIRSPARPSRFRAAPERSSRRHPSPRPCRLPERVSREGLGHGHECHVRRIAFPTGGRPPGPSPRICLIFAEIIKN